MDDETKQKKLDDEDGHKKFDEFLEEVGKDDEFAAHQLGMFAKKVEKEIEKDEDGNVI
jgi:hypothetical protein